MGLVPEAVRRHYPFQSNYLELGDLKYHYLDEGAGEPVVMLHGNPSWSFMYRELVLQLRDSWRVIVPDHIGCGLSDKPDESRYSYTFEQRVKDLEQLLESLHLTGGLNLVLHDWGGPIGLAFATRYPERVRSLVLFNTAGFLVPAGKKLHWTLRLCRTSRIVGYAIRRFNIFARIATRVGVHHRKLSSEIRRAYLAPYDSWKNRRAVLRFIQDIPLVPEDPSYPLLQAVDRRLSLLSGKPVLICWGERDFVFDTDFLDEFIRRFPDARVRRFPRSGHFVLEDAGPEIWPEVAKFLNQPSGPARKP